MLELVDEIVESPVDVDRVHDLLAHLLVRYYRARLTAPPVAG